MIKHFNSKTKKTHYTILYENTDISNNGEFVLITLEANDENDAKVKAMNNDEFTKHIDGKYYDRKYLKAFKSSGLYDTGKVEYIGGDGVK